MGKSAGNELLGCLGLRAKCQCKTGSQTDELLDIRQVAGFCGSRDEESVSVECGNFLVI